MAPSRELRELGLAALFSSACFAAGVLLPGGGPFLGFLSSAGLIWFTLRAGWRLGALAAALALALLLPLVPPQAALFFLLEHALPGCYLGRRLARGRGLAGSSVRAAALAAGALLAAAATYLALSGTDPRTFLEGQIAESLGEVRSSLGTPPAALPPGIEILLQFLRRSFPAVFLIGIFTECAVNGLLALRLASRLAPGTARLPALTQFALPERLVWVLIPSLAALWAPQKLLALLALNVTVLLLYLYLLQGLSILLHFLALARVSRFVLVLVVMALLFQPYLLAIPLVLGLLDFRFDFRRRPLPRPPARPA